MTTETQVTPCKSEIETMHKNRAAIGKLEYYLGSRNAPPATDECIRASMLITEASQALSDYCERHPLK